MAIKKIRFDPDSRYRRNSVLYVDDKDDKRKVNYQPPTIASDPSDDVITVLPAEKWRPDLIANRVYGGRHFLSWVIMRTNMLFHVREIVPGIQLRIPKLNRISGSVV